MLNAIKSITELLSFYPLPTLSPGSTCIIVGSSGVLLQHSGLGKTIDNYDYVIRMNFAPTSKFEDFVGSKTSMHFAYLRSCLIALKNYRQINNSHILYGGEALNDKLLKFKLPIKVHFFKKIHFCTISDPLIQIETFPCCIQACMDTFALQNMKIEKPAGKIL